MDILMSLIQIRKDRKTEQKITALYLGITQTTLSRYENGIREMPWKLIIKYAEYLGYEIRLLKK
jgi:transcriptional regulator with XRE-family HTH domain